MRLLTGAGTPRQFQGQVFPWFFAFLEPDDGLIAMICVGTHNHVAAVAVYVTSVNSG